MYIRMSISSHGEIEGRWNSVFKCPSMGCSGRLFRNMFGLGHSELVRIAHNFRDGSLWIIWQTVLINIHFRSCLFPSNVMIFALFFVVSTLCETIYPIIKVSSRGMSQIPRKSTLINAVCHILKEIESKLSDKAVWTFWNNDFRGWNLLFPFTRTRIVLFQGTQRTSKMF